ncbi:hypothetical protein [Demequina litorisediminis]|uniref:Uncharacterized protein n=1 Tax=Demequina litorisediminis TaxID=1849022 RepID=A0ABQ6IFX2_9MICO|nr:hypothetical protein [Demequina litorisediminis]GMA36195.1 hypothetical protein GCM10025876_23990 [Demequina litorisediminis]
MRSRSWWTGAEGFILVDDYDLVATSQGNPLAPLAALLPQAADLGLHLILTRRAGGAGRAAYDPIIQRLTDIGATGMVLSGNPDEGPVIGKVRPQQAPAGRAQVVSRDRGVFTAQPGIPAVALLGPTFTVGGRSPAVWRLHTRTRLLARPCLPARPCPVAHASPGPVTASARRPQTDASLGLPPAYRGRRGAAHDARRPGHPEG